MNNESARLAIVTQFDAALAAYPTSPKPVAQYPNRNLVDTTTQVLPWVGLDIVNISGKQLDFNPKPLSAQYGQIVITAFCKQNSGERASGLLLDYFLPWFELKELSGVRTQTGMYAKSNPFKDWEGYPIVVPFWWVRVAT